MVKVEGWIRNWEKLLKGYEIFPDSSYKLLVVLRVYKYVETTDTKNSI